MKKQSIIRILMFAIAVSAAVFVVAEASTIKPATNHTEDCTEEKQDGLQPIMQTEYLLEALARNLLGR